MTLSQLWAALAVLLPFLAALIANLSAVDLAYQLRAGSEILGGRGIPSQDTYTFTAAGQPWLDQQWGAQLLLTAIYRLAGWTGLALLRAALVGLIFGLLFIACRLRGADVRRAAWLALAAFVVTAVALALRPQLFGMALFAATLVAIAARRRWPRAIWVAPVIVAVWANVHGSFFLGPLVVGLAWLEDVHDRHPAARTTLGAAVICVVASLVNPFGPAVWSYALGLSTNEFVTSRITEWQPTTLRTVPGLLFFASAAAVAVLIARAGRIVPWPTLVTLATFLAIGAYAERGVAWWPIVAAVAIVPLISAGDPARDSATKPNPLRANAVIVAVLALGCLALVPAWRPLDPATGAPEGLLDDAPSGITAALREATEPGDRILNPQPWGSWFELALPDRLVALDSRIELFRRDVWVDYETVISGGAGWQATLDRWQVDIVVAPADNEPFIDRLSAAGWQAIYEDADGAVLTRNSLLQ